MKSVNSVEEYIALAPPSVQEKLREVRAAIRAAAPDAEEKISYGMPYYGYKGKLAYFAYAAHHVGLYIPPPVVAQHKKELAKYKTATSTIQFPLDEKLPIVLIKKLVKARVAINNEAKKGKK